MGFKHGGVWTLDLRVLHAFSHLEPSAAVCVHQVEDVKEEHLGWKLQVAC